jgi:hypothetical protein
MTRLLRKSISAISDSARQLFAEEILVEKQITMTLSNSKRIKDISHQKLRVAEFIQAEL